MSEIRKVITTRLKCPLASERQIASITRISRPTVKKYLELFNRKPLSLSELESMNNNSLEKHFGLEDQKIIETSENRLLSEWLTDNINRIGKNHVTRRLLHEEYSEIAPSPLSYSQFCFILQQKTQSPETSGMLMHKAGDKAYLDFTGDKYHWLDESGQEYVEEVFLAVNGSSSYFYSEPVPDQKQENFTLATRNAFHHFGGVPNAVVPDCLKSAVLKHDGYEARNNPLFAKMLEHYGAVCIPARPYHPKDKAVVESTVNIVYRRIMAKLSKRVFPDRKAMLSAWMKELEKANSEPFQKLPGSRLSRFMELDKPALKPLPNTVFDITNVLHQKIDRKLFVYVSQDRTSYSIPEVLKGKRVEVLVNTEKIEVWHGNECFATHTRAPGKGKVINIEHLPKAQKWYETRNLEESLRALSPYGVHVTSWAKAMAERAGHEDIAWRIIAGLSKLASKHPERIDMTCRIALGRDRLTLAELKSIIASGEDLAEAEAERLTFQLPFHENIRGSEYYSGGLSV